MFWGGLRVGTERCCKTQGHVIHGRLLVQPSGTSLSGAEGKKTINKKVKEVFIDPF